MRLALVYFQIHGAHSLARLKVLLQLTSPAGRTLATFEHLAMIPIKIGTNRNRKLPSPIMRSTLHPNLDLGLLNEGCSLLDGGIHCGIRVFIMEGKGNTRVACMMTTYPLDLSSTRARDYNSVWFQRSPTPSNTEIILVMGTTITTNTSNHHFVLVVLWFHLRRTKHLRCRRSKKRKKRLCTKMILPIGVMFCGSTEHQNQADQLCEVR